MDFLESLDLDTSNKKCRRVRSWYLYEQYKSLEQNQSDAAERLRNKCYQDNILRQELKERRARRTLCDHFDSCRSESKLARSVQSAPSREPLSINPDDLYESFCVLHDEHLYGFEDNFSQDGSRTSNHFDGFENVEKRDDTDNESVNSIIDTVTFDNNLADDVKGELEIVKQNIAENINLQLETVKENIECLEKFTKLDDADDLPDNESSELFEQCESSQGEGGVKDGEVKKATTCTEDNKDLFTPWGKLVAFAYEAAQFSHGNFYNSYSSQLMLAVLLCDVLGRGICKMCHILQPYVSPIRYATSDSDVSVGSHKSVRRKMTRRLNNCSPITCKSSLKYDSYKHPKSSCKSTIPRRKLRWLLDRECQSENKWQKHSKYSFDNRYNEMKCRRASEPWQCVTKFMRKNSKNSNSSCSIWPEELSRAKLLRERVCKCRCLKDVATPLMQVARYIESILQDVED